MTLHGSCIHGGEYRMEEDINYFLERDKDFWGPIVVARWTDTTLMRPASSIGDKRLIQYCELLNIAKFELKDIKSLVSFSFFTVL